MHLFKIPAFPRIATAVLLLGQSAQASSNFEYSETLSIAFRTYIHALIQTGLATPAEVDANLRSYETAVDQWELQCSLNRKPELLKIIDYGYGVLEKQFPYGIGQFVSPLSDGLKEARGLAASGHCKNFRGQIRLRKEINQMKASLK